MAWARPFTHSMGFLKWNALYLRTAQLPFMLDRKTKIYVKMFTFQQNWFMNLNFQNKWDLTDLNTHSNNLNSKHINYQIGLGIQHQNICVHKFRPMTYFQNNTLQWQDLLILLRSCDFSQRSGKSWNLSQENYVAEKHNIFNGMFSSSF